MSIFKRVCDERGRGYVMKKRLLKIQLMALGMFLFVFLCLCPKVYAVDGSNQTDLEGHRLVVEGSEKGVCDNCHKPHGAYGEKLWARTTQGNTVRDLCLSCHDPAVAITGMESGMKMGDEQYGGNFSERNNKNGNVGLATGNDHVMKKTKWGCEYAIKYYPKDSSPTNPPKAEILDTTKFPIHVEEGFYCGTCHDPHKQPLNVEGNPMVDSHGDYLRTTDPNNFVNVGETHNRKEFCRQCHPTDGGEASCLVQIHKGDEPECEECHRVHDGFSGDKYKDCGLDARLVFVNEMPEEPRWFQSPPSPPSVITEAEYESTNCIRCHMGGYEDAPVLNKDIIHHPTGRKWVDTSCQVDGCHGTTASAVDKIKLDGYDAFGNELARADQAFSCISCHTSHTELGFTNYLRYASFVEDDAAFCQYCHDDPEESGLGRHPKSAENLTGDIQGYGKGKHYYTQAESEIKRHIWNTNTLAFDTEVGCGECMLCHFIHPNDVDRNNYNDDRDTSALDRADLQALMRIPAKVLPWDEGANVNTLDPIKRYEAMCAGCHLDPDIVGKQGKEGEVHSLLDPNNFSHRFACFPKSGGNPDKNIGGDAGFPKADGVPGASATRMDDYGTVNAQIYCGTCHDVHDNHKPPYLHRLDEADTASPYIVDDTVGLGDSFCMQCHAEENNDPLGVGISHPVGDDEGPSNVTVVTWPTQFFGGGSGSKSGVTADTTLREPISGGSEIGGVICLTCHNIHAATTSWDGIIDGESHPPAGEDGPHGKLLVQDNKQSTEGSEMCGACHIDM